MVIVDYAYGLHRWWHYILITSTGWWWHYMLSTYRVHTEYLNWLVVALHAEYLNWLVVPSLPCIFCMADHAALIFVNEPHLLIFDQLVFGFGRLMVCRRWITQILNTYLPTGWWWHYIPST
jgi:hypothetical protein